MEFYKYYCILFTNYIRIRFPCCIIKIMNMNFSHGLDIEEIERFKKYENDINSKFLNRIFTKNELDYCFSKKNPAQHLTARFCAKEASIKAIFSLENKKLFFKQIEIINKNQYQHMLFRIFLLNGRRQQIILRIIIYHCLG